MNQANISINKTHKAIEINDDNNKNAETSSFKFNFLNDLEN